MANEYVETGIPFLRSQNITPFRVSLEGMKFISADFHKRLKKSAMKPGDVAVIRTGYPGTAAVIPRSLPICNCADLVIIRPSSAVDPWFLASLFNSVWGQGIVSSNLVGVAQQHFNVGAAKSLLVRLPPINIQRRIASILAAYDDLIENNTRRIAILEEMARRLYEEWFVHFRFPGHGPAKIVHSLPEGWSTSSFIDLATVMSGGTPKKSNPAFWGGSIPFFTPKDASRFAYALETETSITEAGLEACNSKLFPKDTVFITARGTVGKLALASQEMAMNQSCYALRPQSPYGPLFLFHVLQGAVEELRTRTHGAVFDTIIVDTFKQLDVVLPSPDIATAFEAQVRPMFDLILNLQRRNTNLRAQRDLLLPKLISGEIDVSEAEETLEEAVA